MYEAWIFLAIGDAGGCRGPVGGDDLVAMADSINHRLPTDEELADAIESLVHAGLAVVAGSDYALTEWGCEVYARASHPTQGHIARFLALDDTWRREFPPRGRATKLEQPRG
jgi:hypothetical protein